VNRLLFERLKSHVGGPAIAVVAGAVLAGATAYLDGPKELILVGALVGAGGALWASIQRSAGEEALRKKSEELAELNRFIAGAVTGGNSFCYVAAETPPPGGNKGLLSVVQEGPYPLYE